MFLIVKKYVEGNRIKIGSTDKLDGQADIDKVYDNERVILRNMEDLWGWNKASITLAYNKTSTEWDNISITTNNSSCGVIGFDNFDTPYLSCNDSEGNRTIKRIAGKGEGQSTYKWYRNNKVITGATTTTYIPTADDAGRKIYFEVTPIDISGTAIWIPVKSAGLLINETVNAICGDGIIDTPETCDDNNTVNGDGCSSVCTIERAPTENTGTIWWGSYILNKDICPANRDCTSSYYDSKCEPCSATGAVHPSATTKIGNITNSKFSTEFNNAYLRAYANGLTTMPSIQQANINGKIIREHFAKMITEFAIKVLEKKPDTKKSCTFADAKNESEEMQFYIKTACQLGLMGREADGKNTKSSFDPTATITREQFATIVSRLLYGTTNNSTDAINRATKHLQALHDAKIINNISNPSMEEIRGYVMLMLQRAIVQ